MYKNRFIFKLLGSTSAVGFYLFAGAATAKTNSTTTVTKVDTIKAATPLSINSIYNYLKKTYPSYENVTYGAPTTNTLQANNWLLQTPNIWGYTIDQYNQIFPGNSPDACFNLPTCTTDSDCQVDSTFPATCETPNFLTNTALGCPNGGSTPAGTKLCLSGAHKIITNLYNDITNASSTIDITMLNTGNNFLTEQQFDTSGKPTGDGDAFFFTLKQALTELSQTNKSITIRLLGGSYSNATSLQDTQNFLAALVSNFKVGNKLTIVAVPMRSCPTYYGCDTPYAFTNSMFLGAWNHGKNITIDNNIIYVGGENMWGGDYLSGNPTNDDYVRFEGPVANGGTNYNNALLGYLSSLSGFFNKYTDQCWVYSNGKVATSTQNPCSNTWNKTVTYPKNIAKTAKSKPKTAADLSVQAMYVSKLNGGVLASDEDQSEPARIYAIQNATQSVKLAQQTLFIKGRSIDKQTGQPVLDGTIWPEAPGSVANNPINTMQAISSVFNNNIKNGTNISVKILTTAFNENDGYGADVELSYIYNFICQVLIKTFKVSPSTAQTQLSTNLQLGYVSYNQNIATNGTPGHHNKFWMVDDKVFYFGSHNFYPSSLQQIGIITDSTDAANEVNATFWNKLWENADRSTQAFDPSSVNCDNVK